MAGHSKWSSIKHAKAITDARRGKLFTKLAKEIVAAARQGDGDSASNFRLRMAIQRAKDANMPSANIERAVKKAIGEGTQDRMQEVIYEGYGPGGTAIMLETMTDNRNRTVSELRSTLTKAGGNLAETGSVAWQFEQKGVIVIDVADGEVDDLALAAIDAGADDFESDDSTLHVYSRPTNLEDVRAILSNRNVEIRSSEVSMIATNTVSMDVQTALKVMRLLDHLEDLDDVQRVFSNGDFPNDALDKYSSE